MEYDDGDSASVGCITKNVVLRRRGSVDTKCYTDNHWVENKNHTEEMKIVGRAFHRWRTKVLIAFSIFLLIVIFLSDKTRNDEITNDSPLIKRHNRDNVGNNVNVGNDRDQKDNHQRKDDWDSRGSIGGVRVPHETDKQNSDGGKSVLKVDADDVERQYKDTVDEINRVNRNNKDNDKEKEFKRALNYHNIWTEADALINNKEIFQENSNVEKVLEAMRTAPIVHLDVLDVGDYESGTSEKWVGILEGGQKVMIKLVWPGEKKGTMKREAACNLGFEFPTAEVAAFHMHRLLGYRNTVYVTGRKISIEKELIPAASPQVSKQFKVYDRKFCAVGKCFYCKNFHSLCPPDGMVEASVAYWVPRHLKLYTYPPKYMPYSTPRGDEWEHVGFNNRTYCMKTRKIHPYEFDRYYNDLFDFSVLDYLMYHYDSKHYIVKDGSDAHGLTVRLDHGRAFCANDRDDGKIFLAPLFQCCTLRRSMYERLKVMSNGVLSRRLRAVLASSPIAPVLEDKWYRVLDRRFKRIMILIQQCAKANGGFENILVDDGF